MVQKESNQITKRRALPDSYPVFLQELKQRIRESQVRASVSVNRELVLLYWWIGRDILVRQQRENWGAKVIDRLATESKKAQVRWVHRCRCDPERGPCRP